MLRAPLTALLAAAMLLGGCIYRPDIQQGNLLTIKDIEQVTVGMTRSQVRFLLGTPMVSDPFAPQRWDYVYRMEYGRDRKVDSAHFIVYFEGDKVARVESRDVLEPPRNAPVTPPEPAQRADQPDPSVPPGDGERPATG
jgi:outer membrane protein assembly factor BamE